MSGFSRTAPIAALAALIVSASAFAQEYRVGDLRIGDAYARPTIAAQKAGAAYVSIQNLGTKPDQLVSATSPVSDHAELHTMSLQDNVMKMREVASIAINPAEKIAMAPGQGFHIMLIGLKQPLKQGDTLPLTLRFKNAGTVTLQIAVRERANENLPSPGMMHHR